MVSGNVKRETANDIEILKSSNKKSSYISVVLFFLCGTQWPNKTKNFGVGEKNSHGGTEDHGEIVSSE